MAELRLYARTDRYEDITTEFRNAVHVLDAKVTGSIDDPVTFIEGPEFAPVLGTFRDSLRGLDRPVVLMLDTCEELARFETRGSRLPRVEATMRMMQLIAEDVHGVRVVFAGRRPLASGGAGWALAEPDDALPTRDYLALHVIRGSTSARRTCT